VADAAGADQTGSALLATGAAETLPAVEGGSQIGDLIANAERIGKGGLTDAARSLESHAAKQPELYPKVTGGPAEKNALARQVLKEIVSNPDTIEVPVLTGNQAGGTRFIAPDGRGVTFGPSGEFGYFGGYP
jgi:hypothetical protein